MSPGANRWLVRLRGSGRVHPNPVFQQSYAFTAANLEALSTWPNLQTVLAVEALRSTNGTPEVETVIRGILDPPAIALVPVGWREGAQPVGGCTCKGIQRGPQRLGHELKPV